MTKTYKELLEDYEGLCQHSRGQDQRIEQLEKERDDLRAVSLERAVNAICGHLPEGWQITMQMEKDSGGFVLINPDGDVIDDEQWQDETLINQVNVMLNIANGFKKANQLRQKAHGSLHPDDIAVDKFCHAMKKKLAKKRDEGRGGWEDKDRCSRDFLNQLLCEHVAKGDPVDVANLAMMLWARGESTSLTEHDAELIEKIRDKWVVIFFARQNECHTQDEIIDALDHEIDQLRQKSKEAE